MILYLNDWGKYPDAIVDYKTTNESFLRISSLYKSMGIRNHSFPLALHNRDLQGVDPHSETLSTEDIIAITLESSYNPWYFFREVVRVPTPGTLEPIKFKASRGNISLYWLFFNHITTYMQQIRQTGKSVTCDCLAAYILNIGGRNTKIQLLTKDDNLRVSNIKRVKDIISSLPHYLNLRTKKDTNNTENITISKLNNELITFVSQNSPKDAAKIGRGMTSPIVFIDEFNFINNIEHTMAGLIPSTIAARENAEAEGGLYGNIYTTTAGYLSTRSGRFGYQIYKNGFRWSELLFDSYNLNEVKEIILKNSKSKAPLVILEYNHRQLGKTDEWLRSVIAESMLKGENVGAEFLNRWSQGSSESPIAKEKLEEMNLSLSKDYFADISEYGYTTLWYISKDEFEDGFADRKLVMGLDTSDALGMENDSIAMCLRDVYSGEVVAVGEYNETNIVVFSEWVANFLIKYQNITLVPERRSSGTSILDNIIKMFCLSGVNPYRRIFNWSVNNISAIGKDDDELRLIRSYNISSRDIDTFSKYKKKFGYATSGAGLASRNSLYGETLTASVKLTSNTVRDRRLFEQISSLVIKNGRIDHSAGSHDDLVVAWLLSFWFLIKCENFRFYGIDPTMVLSSLVLPAEVTSGAASGHIDLIKKYNNEILKEKIKELMIELEESTNIEHRDYLENKIRFTYSQIEDDAYKTNFNLDSYIERYNKNKIYLENKYNMAYWG